MPRVKESETAIVTGNVTVQGKPLAEGTVIFTSLDMKPAKPISGIVKDGGYTVKDLPSGKYAVAITSEKKGAVPVKFGTAETSGLTYQARSGKNQYDIELK
jgi:hypothetical protein